MAWSTNCLLTLLNISVTFGPQPSILHKMYVSQFIRYSSAYTLNSAIFLFHCFSERIVFKRLPPSSPLRGDSHDLISELLADFPWCFVDVWTFFGWWHTNTSWFASPRWVTTSWGFNNLWWGDDAEKTEQHYLILNCIMECLSWTLDRQMW